MKQFIWLCSFFRNS